MEVISRNDAITLRRARYFTGRPCGKGHVSPRYVKSWACCECKHPRYESVDTQQRLASRHKALAAREEMESHGFILHAEDVDNFAALSLFYARLREPALAMGDVRITKGKRNHRTRYLFRIFWDDREVLLEAERTFAQAHSTAPSAFAKVRARRGDRVGMIKRTFDIHPSHMDAFASSVLTLSARRNPELEIQDIKSPDKGDAHCVFYIFPDDEAQLRKLERDLVVERPCSHSWESYVATDAEGVLYNAQLCAVCGFTRPKRPSK